MHCVCFPFAGPTVGPLVPVSDDTTILNVFNTYFTPDVWNLLVVETNWYATQCRGAQPPTRADRRRPWHDVTTEEMAAYIGVCILMGIAILPRIEMYWSQKHAMRSQPLSQVMSLTRFEQISRYLHVCDTSEQVPYGQPGYDPLFKLRNFLDLITPQLQSEYNPHEQMSIDEATKPTKWGIEVFVLADSINGYVYRLQIYTGKNRDLDATQVH